LVIIIGGILMIIGSSSGLSIFSILVGLYNTYGVGYVSDAIGKNLTTGLAIILRVILYIMAGGGISVIIGAILVLINFHKIGKIIISLGSGMGLVGIIIFIIWSLIFVTSVGFFILRLLIDIYFIGVVMTVIGRKKMKKKEEFEFNEDILSIATENEKVDIKKSNNKITCAICKSINPENINYCRYCGTKLKYDLENYL